jgi:hypothetical protein
MDPLGLIANVTAVLQLANDAVKFLSDVKDAPKECSMRMEEVSNLNELLSRLHDRLNEALSEASTEGPWHAEVQALAIENGPLDQYKQALQDLFLKVKPANGTRKLANALMWSFVKEEVAGIFERTERLKTHVSIVLELDHL